MVSPQLPMRMWCAVRICGSRLMEAASNTNLLELKCQCLVCCINQFFTSIKGQRSERVLLS